MCLREFMLTKPMVCTSVLYVITGAFLILILALHPKAFSGFQDLMQKAISFNDIVIISVKGI